MVAHEFPSWHLFASFELFHLPDTKESRKLNGEDLERNLERLAQAFNVSTDKLKREFTQLQPIAAALKKSAGHSNRDAWRQAVLRVGQRPGQKAATSALCTLHSAGKLPSLDCIQQWGGTIIQHIEKFTD